MNYSLLYQAYGVKDYSYASTEYKGNAIYLHLKTNSPKRCLCPHCGGHHVIKYGIVKRTLHNLPFGYEYQSEQEEYAKRKEMEEDAKLTAMLKYTRDTFNRLDFEEIEVSQISECVRYFLTNRQPLSNTEIRISKRSTVTQIALKNFAWNIAYPYNMSGDTTAAFVFNTFNEWFANTTIATIKKTLRTTTGRHKIEIDERLLSKYINR